MEMMKSGRGLQDEEEDDEEEFLSKKSVSSHKGDGKRADQRANTPRSKHSATEQRRRCKINERFQILRDLIPENDQKRDKASFLLEVIEYVQLLQEKVHRYEASASYQGWNQEPLKLTPWRNGHGPAENMVDHSRAINNGTDPALMFAAKFDDNSMAGTPSMLTNTQNPLESDLSTSSAYKAMDHHSGLANRTITLPVPLQPNTFSPLGRSSGLAQQGPISDVDNMESQPPTQLWQSTPCTTECHVTNDVLNERGELTIEGGTISIAGVYSQRLLNNLTQALQSSGVDLSQASISVQVDVGNRAINRLTTMTSGSKDHKDPCSRNQAMSHSRVASSGEDSDPAQKRLKTRETLV